MTKQSKAGGQRRWVPRCGVWQTDVSNWRVRGNVPAEYCPLIENATGVRCEELQYRCRVGGFAKTANNPKQLHDRGKALRAVYAASRR